MSKFNATKEAPEKVINHMGAKSFASNEKMELIGILLTSFVEDQYYRGSNETLERLRQLIDKCDKEFVAKAAIYARTVFGMRSISHVVAAELAKHASGKEWAKDFYNSVVYRPDDMLEIAAYYFANCAVESTKSKHGKKNIPNSMRKGFSMVFDRLTEYSLAKYRGENKEIKMIDLVNIVCPVPNAKNAEALKKLVAGKLVSKDTWESELSAAGANAKDEAEKSEFKKDVWVKMIKEKKIKYFALLRNLRNILQQAPEVIGDALNMLTDKEEIKKSLVLPFRYLSAYTEIEKLKTEKPTFEKDKVNVDDVLKAIEKAINLSIDNLPTLAGRTLILSDNSGSMRGDGGGSSRVSRFSNTRSSDIANLFATMYWTKCDNTMVGLFGDRIIHPKMDRSKGVFENFKIVDNAAETCGGATEAGIFTMFERMIKEKIICDTVVVFSDCQIGSGCKWYGDGNKANDFDRLFKEYKKINPKFRAYSVDLHSYGTTVFDGSVIKIAGWSDRIFDVMKYAEQDKDAMIKEIEKVSLVRINNNSID